MKKNAFSTLTHSPYIIIHTEKVQRVRHNTVIRVLCRYHNIIYYYARVLYIIIECITTVIDLIYASSTRSSPTLLHRQMLHNIMRTMMYCSDNIIIIIIGRYIHSFIMVSLYYRDTII